MKNPYLPIPVKVKRVIVESDDKTLKTIETEFVNEGDKFSFMPGQFCELSILGKGEAPFGIASSPTEETLKFTVNRVGVVTTALHYLEEGEEIGIRGPLGNYYPIEEFKQNDVVIIGGGFAFTTLRALLVYMLENRRDYGEITVIYGVRRSGLFLYQEELEEWEKRGDLKLYRCIDWRFDDKGPIKEEPAEEGWEPINFDSPGKTEIKEEQNKFTAFVPQLVEAINLKPSSYAVVCGPPIMIKLTLPVLTNLGFSSNKVYTSLERRMKCGIGKCGRCNIGPKYVCIDGPVFSLEQLNSLPKEE
jgi:NAD(P)H-flavin reductase